jgi:SNF2 family DNA or RNA helicase
MDFRFRSGVCVLSEPVDHPAVVEVKRKKKGVDDTTSRWEFPLRPEVVVEMYDKVEGLDRYLPRKFYEKWVEALDHSHVIKSVDPDRIKLKTKFKLDMFDHQKRALAFSLSLPSSALFLETGTGKTFVALANIETRIKAGQIKSALIIAPQSILQTGWLADCHKFTSLRPIIVHPSYDKTPWVCPFCRKSFYRLSKAHAQEHYDELNDIRELVGDRRRTKSETDDLYRFVETPNEFRWNELRTLEDKVSASGFDVWITSPEYLGLNLEAFMAKKWDMVVLDEATVIKNHSAARTKAIHKIAWRTRYRLALTGSPVTNSLQDMWSIMYFVDQSLGGNYREFREKYFFQPSAKFHPYFWVPNDGSEEEIVEATANRCLRITKAECLDLPPRTEVIRNVSMSVEGRRHYKSLHEEMFTILDDGSEVTTKMKQVQLRKLHQVSNGFLIENLESGDKNLHIIDQVPPKVREIQSIMDELSRNQKVVIWAVYRQDYAFLLDGLKRYHPVYINGATNSSHIPRIVETFRDDPTCRIMIAHPQSCKFGHTWTWANTCIYYTWDHSVESFLQSRDRIYRIGQENPVTEVFLVASKLEQEILSALRKKSDFSREVTNSADFRSTWERFAA